MHPIQIVLLVFAVLALLRVWRRRRVRPVRKLPLVLWSLAWLGVVATALAPDATNVLARLFGVGRGADLVLYLAMLLVFHLLFRAHARIEDHEHQLSVLARMEALRRFEGEYGPFRSSSDDSRRS